MFFPPIPLIRRNHIIKKLLASDAASPEKAVTLREAGIINPDAFGLITRRLEEQGIVVSEENGRYWLNKERL